MRHFGKSPHNLGPIAYFFPPPLLSIVNLELRKVEIVFLICGFGNLDRSGGAISLSGNRVAAVEVGVGWMGEYFEGSAERTR